MGGFEISLSCHAFALLSCTPNVLVDFRSLLLFAVCCSLSMHCCLCAPAVALFLLFLAAGVCVYYCFYLITRTDLDFFFFLAQPSLTLLGLNSYSLYYYHAHIFLPSLLDAVLSVAPPPMTCSCYYRPILFVCDDQEACYRLLRSKKYMNIPLPNDKMRYA